MNPAAESLQQASPLQPEAHAAQNIMLVQRVMLEADRSFGDTKEIVTRERGTDRLGLERPLL
jgi:hypothetical protein